MDRVGPKNGPHQTGSREERNRIAWFEVIYVLRGMNNRNVSREQIFGKLAEGKRGENSAIVRQPLPVGWIRVGDDYGCILACAVAFRTFRYPRYNWPMKANRAPNGGHWNQTEAPDQISRTLEFLIQAKKIR